ncbi:MAG: baseplate J/gp47 family protein [Bryobacteraceae bacterium]|nr:baseplate J/gp47 family protein [Bryobacteraceae bacterium]
MNLNLQSFTTLVANGAAAVQGSSRQLLDLSVGSTLRAVLEASASVGLWMQWLAVRVLRMTRAATSEGADLDSWVADFGLTRLPGVAAMGTVTVSRFVAASSALVPVGTAFRTADGTLTFATTEDSSSPAWADAQGGYLLPAGLASLTVPVACSSVGLVGNVQAGTVSLVVGGLPGIDTVTNAAAMQGGLDAEGDAALRGRFQNYIASRSRSTLSAIGYAISSIRQGLEYAISENLAPDGTTRLGCFVVSVDDGTGNPSDALLATVASAIEAVRPVGSTYSVRKPTVTTLQIVMTVDVSDSTLGATARQAVAAAVASYVNALTIGEVLRWSRLAQLAYAAHVSVSNVRNITVNGGTGDTDPGEFGVLKVGTVSVN